MATLLDIAKLANDSYKDSYLDLKSMGFEDLKINYNGSNGFQGSSYYNPTTKELVIAYTGTNGINDWDDDFLLGVLRIESSQTGNAKEFLDETFRILEGKDGFDKTKVGITITGHSLGGYLAQTQIKNFLTDGKYSDIPRENIAGVAFNTPGIGADEDIPNTLSINAKYDMVSESGGNNNTEHNMVIDTGKESLVGAHSLDVLIEYLETHPAIGRIDISIINGLDSDIQKILLNTPEDFIVYIKENEHDTYKKLSENNFELAKELEIEYNNQKAVNAIKDFNNGSQDFGEVIKWVSNSPKAISEFKSILEKKGNDNLLKYIKDENSFKNAPNEIQKVIVLETQEGNALSTQLGTSIGGSIGSVIIGNNDFSNIEKIAISTSTTVVGQNVGEYLGGKSDAFDNIDKDLGNTLQGAVLSFAISSFFAKNDTLADILGMDGTFVGGLADFTVSYTLGYYGSQAISDLFAFSVNNISYSNNKIFKNLA